MKRWRLLWVDDEPHHISSHVDALRESGRFDVQVERDPSTALARLERGDIQPEIILWDMIIGRQGVPDPRFAPALTADGIEAGRVFFAEMRRLLPVTPAVLLTNDPRSDVDAVYNDPEHGSWYAEKLVYLPDELPRYLLEDVLGEPRTDDV